MRHDDDIKTVAMIPGPRHETANGASSSAKTYGSGAVAGNLKGIVDTAGYRRARVRLIKSLTSAPTSLRLFFQSGAATLCASAYNASGALSGYTSGKVFSVVAVSGGQYLVDIDLTTYSKRKRYLNAKVTTCNTCGYPMVLCDLTLADTFPPATTGYTTTIRYAG